MRVVRGLADAVEHADAQLPFALGELGLADEGVHVAHEAGHHFAQPRAVGAVHGLQHGVGDLGLVVDDHRPVLPGG